MDSKAWTLGLVALAVAVALAELGWLAEAEAREQAAATRAAGVAFLALAVHAAATPAVVWLGGKIDRRTDALDRGQGAVLLMSALGVVAALAAGVGAAVLPGPWHAAAAIALCVGLVAVILSWTTAPAVRRVDFESAFGGTPAMLAPLVLLPAAVAAGTLVRLGVHVVGVGA